MSAAVRHRFERQELDGTAGRARLLNWVVQLAAALRSRNQVARGLTLQLDFAAGARWAKTLRLPEASAHDEDLRTPAYRLMDRAGLQRGRLTGVLLRLKTCEALEKRLRR
ncbi:DinB/UmuC family translesion DNA polymerase [Streptomyces sp. SGAir0957]